MERIAKLIEEILLGGFDKLQECIAELNSWNGCLDYLEYYENDEDFFELFFGNRSIDMYHAMKYGDYNFEDEYVQFNGYGNLNSYSYSDMREDLESHIEEVVENLIEYRDEINIRWVDSKIADLLDELDEIEE